MIRQATERTPRVVRVDRWDVADWDDTRQEVGRLANAAEDLAQVHEAGPDVLADVFASVFKQTPEFEPDHRITPDRVINRAVINEFVESADYPGLHRVCAGDRIQSAMTAVAMADTVGGIYSRVGEKLDAEATTLQDALDALERLTGPEGSEPDPEAVAEAEQAVADAEEALTAAVDGQLAGIGRDVRKAATQARVDAEEQAEAMAAWGVDGGERCRMDATSYLALAERLRSPRLREITRLFGAMRNLTWGARRTKVNRLPEELHDITLGDDLAHILPTELLALAVPEMEDDFFMRLLAAEVMVYELQGIEREGQGGIVYLEDGSGSMKGPRELWAKAVGLALLGIAKDQGRSFHVIHFGGRGTTLVFSFPEPAAFTTERMLDFAEAFLNSGGTCFETPLTEAATLLAAEHAATGKATADIVLATDGDAAVSDAWLAWFRAEQDRLGITTFGLAIGADGRTSTLDDICGGRVADVRDLHTGNDARSVFAGVS